MVAPLVVYGLVTAAASAASAIYKGSSAKNTADANSEAARFAAEYNADQQYSNTLSNNILTLSAAQANAEIAQASGEAMARVATDTAGYNSLLVRDTAWYNASLLEHEQDLIYEALDLDVTQRKKEVAQIRGQAIANFGASGTVIDEGSNFDVVAGINAEEAFGITVLRHNADLEYTKLENAKRQGLWEAELQASQIMYAGEMQAYSYMVSSIGQAANSLINAGLSSTANLINASTAGDTGQYNANIQANNYTRSGNQAFTNGLFSAGVTAVKAGTSAYGDLMTQKSVTYGVTAGKPLGT